MIGLIGVSRLHAQREPLTHPPPVADLHLLLRAAGEQTPFVLAGASIGGIFIRAYQREYPGEVAGLVFSNTTQRAGKVVPGRGALLWELSEEEIRSAYPLPDSVTNGPPPSRITAPFDRLPPELQAIRQSLELRRWRAWDRAAVGPQPELSWRKAFIRGLDESCSGRKHPLGDLPIVVISSRESASRLAREGRLDREFCDRTDAADGLDRLSSNSSHIVARGSGHEIHLHQPELVVRAIAQLVTALRRRS